MEDEVGQIIPVPRVLDELRDIIRSADLVKLLPAQTTIFRVRPHKRDETCNTWQSLGSPPDAKALSNRMSAAGISMFYGALDRATARAEVTAGMRGRDSRVLTGASWTTTSPLTVLDLTALPEPPGVFAASRRERNPLLFLSRFVKEITGPVTHDGRATHRIRSDPNPDRIF